MPCLSKSKLTQCNEETSNSLQALLIVGVKAPLLGVRKHVSHLAEYRRGIRSDCIDQKGGLAGGHQAKLPRDRHQGLLLCRRAQSLAQDDKRSAFLLSGDLTSLCRREPSASGHQPAPHCDLHRNVLRLLGLAHWRRHGAKIPEPQDRN
jgi:hypothetical protein